MKVAACLFSKAQKMLQNIHFSPFLLREISEICEIIHEVVLTNKKLRQFKSEVQEATYMKDAFINGAITRARLFFTPAAVGQISVIGQKSVKKISCPKNAAKHTFLTLFTPRNF